MGALHRKTSYSYSAVGSVPDHDAVNGGGAEELKISSNRINLMNRSKAVGVISCT